MGSREVGNESNITESAGRLRIGLVQHRCGPDRDENLAKTEALIRDAASDGAQLVVTQELFAGRYFPQLEDAKQFEAAETVPGPTTRWLCGLAGELGVGIIGSVFERRAAGVYHNTAVLIAPDGGGRLERVYRKMHIPDDPGFYEKFYFTPGDGGTDAWAPGKCGGVSVGMLVCWDQWFPEAARLCALRGAQVLAYPTAIGWGKHETEEERLRQHDAWRTVQRSHAIANGVFVVAVNRVGTEEDLEFWGGSFVADPGGRVIAEAGTSEEQVVIADCDLGMIERARQDWPFLRDRRVDAYGGLEKRYGG